LTDIGFVLGFSQTLDSFLLASSGLLDND